MELNQAHDTATQRDDIVTPPEPSSPTSMVALSVAEPQDGVTTQQLHPIDTGFHAWMFCICGFVLEMMVWGFGFRSVLLVILYGRICAHTSRSPSNQLRYLPRYVIQMEDQEGNLSRLILCVYRVLHVSSSFQQSLGSCNRSRRYYRTCNPVHGGKQT